MGYAGMSLSWEYRNDDSADPGVVLASFRRAGLRRMKDWMTASTRFGGRSPIGSCKASLGRETGADLQITPPCGSRRWECICDDRNVPIVSRTRPRVRGNIKSFRLLSIMMNEMSISLWRRSPSWI